MGSQNRVEHKIHITKNKTSQLQLLADSIGKSTQALIARIVKSVCKHGFYHHQLSHDKEFLNRLETVAETHRMARSELIRYAVVDMVRRLELNQSNHDSLWSRDSERG